MVRHYREDFGTRRPSRHGKKPDASTPWQREVRRLWLGVAFTAVRVSLRLAQSISHMAAMLLQHDLLPLAVVRWMLRVSYAFTRLSFRILRRCMRGRSKH